MSDVEGRTYWIIRYYCIIHVSRAPNLQRIMHGIDHELILPLMSFHDALILPLYIVSRVFMINL